jgi:hypothetical protein
VLAEIAKQVGEEVALGEAPGAPRSLEAVVVPARDDGPKR